MELFPSEISKNVFSEIEQNGKGKKYQKMTSPYQTNKAIKKFEYLKFCQVNSTKLFGKKYSNGLKG